MNDSRTLAELLANANPEQAAVILPEDQATITFQALTACVDALSARLCATYSPGTVVAIVLPNGLENLAAFLAVTRARLVAAPLNPAYKADEVRFYLEDAEAKAVIGPAETHPIHEVAAALGLPVLRAVRDRARGVRLDADGLSATAAKMPVSVQPDDVALFLH